jgi:hypothetical protein
MTLSALVLAIVVKLGQGRRHGSGQVQTRTESEEF